MALIPFAGIDIAAQIRDRAASDPTRYPVLLVDPPWPFSAYNPATASRHVGHHYPTMTMEAIYALPVGDLATEHAAVFLWATTPNLPAAFSALEAWGFTYRTTAFGWVKVTRAGRPAMGMGYYTRQNIELCLLGVRGRMQRTAHDVEQVLLAQRREHSRKPDETYERIARLFAGPYLELFARQRYPGWDALGNQVEAHLPQPALPGTIARDVVRIQPASRRPTTTRRAQGVTATGMAVGAQQRLFEMVDATL